MNVLDQVRLKKEPVLLFSVDAKKAFDQVNWVCMKCVLEIKEHGGHMLKWISLLYADQVSMIS